MHASQRWVIALFTVAFLLARLTGAHLHLCLDGNEPLAQLHVSDNAEVDHHHGDTQSHEDVDVDALGNALAKVAKLDLPVLAILALCFALLCIVAMRLPAQVALRQPPRGPPRYVRPLLRAPPA